jgi:hypothetical protein
MSEFSDQELYAALDYWQSADVDEILATQSLLFINPVGIRAEILKRVKKGGLPALSRAATLIAIMGPNPDATDQRIVVRNPDENKRGEVERARALVSELSAYLVEFSGDKNPVRGTQFQAAFPDLIFKARKFLMNTKNWSPQRFVGPDVYPLALQFPGSGALIPENMHDGYITFMTAFSETISRGLQPVNMTIVHQSLSWKIGGIDIHQDNSYDDKTKTTVPDEAKQKTKVNVRTGRLGSGQMKTGGSSTWGHYEGSIGDDGEIQVKPTQATAPPVLSGRGAGRVYRGAKNLGRGGFGF